MPPGKGRTSWLSRRLGLGRRGFTRAGLVSSTLPRGREQVLDRLRVYGELGEEIDNPACAGTWRTILARKVDFRPYRIDWEGCALPAPVLAAAAAIPYGEVGLTAGWPWRQPGGRAATGPWAAPWRQSFTPHYSLPPGDPERRGAGRFAGGPDLKARLLALEGLSCRAKAEGSKGGGCPWIRDNPTFSMSLSLGRGTGLASIPSMPSVTLTLHRAGPRGLPHREGFR